ncbi:MAG: hypothetical protein R2824_09830 [Saprospiraceae bacterium]
MNGTKYLEDHILLSLLVPVGENMTVSKEVFISYRQPFLDLFTGVYDNLSKADSLLLLRDSFAAFWDRIEWLAATDSMDARLIWYLIERGPGISGC